MVVQEARERRAAVIRRGFMLMGAAVQPLLAEKGEDGSSQTWLLTRTNGETREAWDTGSWD